MPKFNVLRNIFHGEKDGTKKPYRKGDSIDLTKAEAEPLIAIGHLAIPEKDAAKEAK